jgi:acetolactate synthase-1/2/3 large subunit
LKVADLVAEWLAKHTKHVFCISGGASLHLIHGIAARKDISYVCPQNEQTASFAADTYARLTGFGCALATSGPGATNLVTGIAASYYDSTPVLYLTGNQTLGRLGHGLNVRQYGFQAMPIVEVVRPITKWAQMVMTPSSVLTTLEGALRVMNEGRPGPVLIDFPDDIQRAEC